MGIHTRRALLALVAAVAGVVAPSGVTPVVGAGTSSFCGLAGFPVAHTYVWTGGAHDGVWQTAANWSVGGVPAVDPPGSPYDPNGPDNLDDTSRDVDYVCLGREPNGTPADVTLGGPFFAGAAVAALDLGRSARLTVTAGSRLWLNRAASSQPSKVRAGSTLLLRGSTLGGVGTLAVSGTLDAVSAPSFPVTITTRYCDVGATCPSAPTAVGTLKVTVGGTFAVDGDPATSNAGINLEDERRVDNSGTIVIANKGYVAADHGTKITNRLDGTIDIRNDFGIYEGRNDFAVPLPVLANSGTLTKSAGTGTSVLGVTVPQGATGGVVVSSGTLTLNRSSTTKGVAVPSATVTQGSSYGLGSCPAVVAGSPGGCSSLDVTASNPQAATVTLGATAGSSTVGVSTQSTGLPPGHVGQAVQLETPGATPTTTAPSLFALLYDVSLLNGRTLASLVMQRADDSSTTFVVIPDCRLDGVPPGGAQSCVDRRGIAGVSSAVLPGGDVRVVVRTTQNSRWVAT